LTEINITKLSNTVVIDDESKIVTISAPGPQGADGIAGGSLEDLSDTVILSPMNKNLLFYESATSKWKNAAIDTTYVAGLGTAAVKNTGTSQSSVILGDDSRLSDARTPTAHNQALSTITDAGGAAALNVGTVAGTVAAGDDSRLSDARTPSSTLDHDASKITTGTLVVGRGGTGLTSVSTLLNSNTTKSDVGLGNVTNIEAQPVNAGLTAIAGLTSAANKGIQFTGSGTAAVYTLTTAGKALLDDADAATQRQTLGLGTAAVLAAGTGNLNVVQLSGLGALPAVSGSALTGLNAGNFSSGTLAVARGGTGLTSISTLLNSNTTKSDVGLSAVENTALTTWAGSESITTTGTVGTGVWNATAILDTKIDLRVDHGVTFDGGGSVIESGKVVYVPVERAGVIKAATLVADASGAITITITRYDPDADATTLGGSAAVGSIALATKIINRDTTLSGWTLAVAEGDVLAFTTGGTIATVTRVTCKLKVELA
jgi:hypothetical protein